MNSMSNDITCKIDGLMRAKETDKHGILVHSRYKSLLEDDSPTGKRGGRA